MLTLSPTLPKRLQRPDDVPPFVITSRDVEIVRRIDDLRCLTSEQIVRALRIHEPQTSHQHVLRRLQLLFGHHYLDRPHHQHFHVSAFAPTVYAVGREGVRLLSTATAPDPRQLWKAKKNRRITASFLRHTIETAEVMLAIEEHATRHQLHLIDHSALRPLLPVDSQTLDMPFRFRVPAQLGVQHLTIHLQPDRVFSIAGLPDNQRLNFALELDRGTEQLSARKLTHKSTFTRKIVGYDAAWRVGLYKSQLGMNGMRVLFVTTSLPRIKGMLTVQKKLIGDRLSSMFLYTTLDALNEHGPLAPIWTSTQQSGISLVPHDIRA